MGEFEEFALEEELGPERLKAIGVLTVEWAHLDDEVSVAIWELSEVGDDVGMAITTGLSLRNRFQIVRTLVSQLNVPAEDEAFKMLDANIQEVSGERNLIIHGLPVVLKESAGGKAAEIESLMFKRDKRQEIYAKMEPLTVHSIREVIEKIRRISHDLRTALDRCATHRGID